MLKSVKYKLSVLDKIMPLTKGVRHLFILNLLFSIAIIVSGFIAPLFYKIFIEVSDVSERQLEDIKYIAEDVEHSTIFVQCNEIQYKYI